MSRKRSDYDQSNFCRLKRFADGECKDELFGSEDKEERYRLARQKELEDDAILESQEKDIEDIIQAERKRKVEAMYHKYENWPQTKGIRIFQRFYQLMSVGLCVCIIAALLIAVSYLPSFGNRNNPINNEVPQRYIEEGIEETGAINFVTGMILDYRAFDTLGESHVLFIAACCVLILLRKDGKKKMKKERIEIKDKILQKISFVIIPPIFIYGIYVILNGHLSPGGGFSGGAIIGAGLILYLNAFGEEKMKRFFTYKTFQVISVGSLLFYAAAKSYSFYTGANHIESIISKGTPGNILSSGLILPLNIAVGLVVACTMYAFYALFKKGEL